MTNRRVLMGLLLLPTLPLLAEGAMDIAKSLESAKTDLVARHGAAQEARITRGLHQAAAVWRPSDGDFAAFAQRSFISDDKQLDAVFGRLEGVFEQVDGTFNDLSREMRKATDLEVGPLLEVDPVIAGWDPSAHVVDDLFDNKLGFTILLNFPAPTLQEKLRDGASYSRRQWAELRLTDRFAQRVPADVKQNLAATASAADLYIAEYNIWAHHLLNARKERIFPSGKRLITHWNLRDEIKANYKDPRGLDKQRLLLKVMDRIVTQSIPLNVINNPRLDWDPVANTVTAGQDIEADAPASPLAAVNTPEPDTRYARLLAQFKAARQVDPYSPLAPTAIARSFEQGRQMQEERVVALLKQVLTSPMVPKVASEIQKALGRKLEPQDIWYAGFKPQGKQTESELDAICQKKYPTREAFAADVPRILRDLGFAPARADYLASNIVVDSSRGAGHAMQAMRRQDKPHLRTRVEKDGMNYKGYNIAVHELGHNVEQVFSLYDIDHTLLQGVPNNAFTEALAFVFQARDLELLGLQKPDPQSERNRVLNDFWQTFEIAAVALVDVAVWHWMYDHPDATPAQVRDAVVKIAKDTWNTYDAPVLGGKDSTLLGIYSHMISYPLYLADYPLGHIIAFQIEEQLRKSPALGPEFERMAVTGSVIPDVWMQKATGAPVSAEPLLRATEKALKTR